MDDARVCPICGIEKKSDIVAGLRDGEIDWNTRECRYYCGTVYWPSQNRIAVKGPACGIIFTLRMQLEEKEREFEQRLQTTVEALITKACRAVLPALKNYRCQYTMAEDDMELALVDKLCAPDADDIMTGKAEMELLADAICGAIIEACRAEATGGDKA